jgi:hypothetical protein
MASYVSKVLKHFISNQPAHDRDAAEAHIRNAVLTGGPYTGATFATQSPW